MQNPATLRHCLTALHARTSLYHHAHPPSPRPPLDMPSCVCQEHKTSSHAASCISFFGSGNSGAFAGVALLKTCKLSPEIHLGCNKCTSAGHCAMHAMQAMPQLHTCFAELPNCFFWHCYLRPSVLLHKQQTASCIHLCGLQPDISASAAKMPGASHRAYIALESHICCCQRA